MQCMIRMGGYSSCEVFCSALWLATPRQGAGGGVVCSAWQVLRDLSGLSVDVSMAWCALAVMVGRGFA